MASNERRQSLGAADRMKTKRVELLDAVLETIHVCALRFARLTREITAEIEAAF